MRKFTYLAASFVTLLALFTSTSVAYAASPTTLSSWATSTPMTHAMDQFYATTYGGYVYVFAGSGPNVSGGEVYSAPLNADGTVGSWTQQASYTGSTDYRIAGATSNGYVYIVGGRNGGPYNTVYSTALVSGGKLGVWTTEANTLPAALYNANAIVYGGYLYVLGGDNNTSAVDTIYEAPLNSSTGAVGTWTTATTTMPTLLEHGAAFVYNNYAYYMGGIATTTATSTVYSAPLSANGGIGSWTKQAGSPLPAAVYGPGYELVNGYVYIMGGYNASNAPVNTVYIAPLSANGGIGSWTKQAGSPLPQVTGTPGSATYNNFLYVLGGADGSGKLSTVYWAHIGGALTFTLTFNTQGGSSVSTQTNQAGATITLPAAPTRSGYTFQHWNTASDGSGTSYAAGASYTMPVANTTLYAIWQAQATTSNGGGIPPWDCATNPLPGATSVVSPACAAEQAKYLKSPVTPRSTSAPAAKQKTAGAATTSGKVCTAYSFTRTLEHGSEGEDVRALQTFLNCEGFTLAATGPGSPGHETRYFGSLTQEALNRFQQAYASSVLTPVHETVGTGIFGHYSQAEAARLAKGS